MFGLAAGLYNSYLAPAKISILMVGLDGSGKTSLLERCKVTQFNQRRGSRSEMSLPDHLPPVLNLRRRHSTMGPIEEKEVENNEGNGALSTPSKGREGRLNSESSLTPSPSTPVRRPSQSHAKGEEEGEDKRDRGDLNNNNGGHDMNGNDNTASKLLSKNNSDYSQQRRRMFGCPSPAAYANATEGDEDEDVVMALPNSNGGRIEEEEGGEMDSRGDVGQSSEDERDDGNVSEEMAGSGLSSAPLSSSSLSSMNGAGSENMTNNVSPREKKKKRSLSGNIVRDHDLKRGAKMLPLDKIRPTVGMNFGKLDACGCKCSFWDVAGTKQMRPLWERYYPDADGIVFVVDASPTPAARSKLREARDTLRNIRSEEILDTVPILVFANKLDVLPESNDDDVVPPPPPSSPGMMVDPDLDLNDMLTFFDLQGGGVGGDHQQLLVLCGGSAKTGEGVRAAFEWLIPKAKKAQREKLRAERI